MSNSRKKSRRITCNSLYVLVAINMKILASNCNCNDRPVKGSAEEATGPVVSKGGGGDGGAVGIPPTKEPKMTNNKTKSTFL